MIDKKIDSLRKKLSGVLSKEDMNLLDAIICGAGTWECFDQAFSKLERKDKNLRFIGDCVARCYCSNQWFGASQQMMAKIRALLEMLEYKNVTPSEIDNVLGFGWDKI